ncbi:MULTISPECIES: hypothetical protein [unclassified Streptomyces]
MADARLTTASYLVLDVNWSSDPALCLVSMVAGLCRPARADACC